jgi:hypothetical protein
MCPTHRPEGHDSVFLSDEIVNRKVHIGIGVPEPAYVLPKALPSRFPAIGHRLVRRNMHRMRGDEFVKETQVSCSE